MDVAGMTLQTSEGHPGLGTDVFGPQSLQWDEEGSMAGRSVCESEQIQVLETPHLTSLLPVAPDGCLVLSIRLVRDIWESLQSIIILECFQIYPWLICIIYTILVFRWHVQANHEERSML